jgi:hypothetical protein
MNAAYLIGTLVGAIAVLDGIWMAAHARPLLPIPRWNYPTVPAALRLMGVAEILSGTGIAAGFSVLAAYGPGPVPIGAFIVFLGIVGQSLAYVAAWWVNYRTRHPVLN